MKESSDMMLSHTFSRETGMISMKDHASSVQVPIQGMQ